MRFICFDTEDNSRDLLESGKSGFDKSVTQIAALSDCGRVYYSRGKVKEFLNWLRRQPEKYIYAHNLQYDLGNLFGDKLDCLDMVLVGGRLIRAKWENKIFVDSFNIWPMSLKRLGTAFDLNKLETDSMSDDKSYVFRDVEILIKAMAFAWDFCEPLGINHLPPTLGGLCVKVWKAFGGINCHDSNELSRKAYYGGRVELFKRRNETERVCYTDINSLYPFCMVNPFPDAMEDFGQTIPKYGIVSCRVTVPQMEIPPLPFRNEAGRILFPVGTFSGVWTTPELTAAIKRGVKIKKVFECIGSNESINPYQTFVEKIYGARLAATNEAEKLFFKLLLNNLYGRLGSSGVIGRTVWQDEKNKFDGVPYGEKILVEYQMPLSEETNWCHAAFVTAYGRVLLLDYMDNIGAENLIYCDTDSTIFDCPGEIPFAVGKDLGQMKLESWETRCETFAPKMYISGKNYKAKGVPQRLAKQFIETGKAEFDLPFKVREAIRFFDRNNARKLSVWRKVVKENKQTYDRKNLIGNRYFPCKV